MKRTLLCADKEVVEEKNNLPASINVKVLYERHVDTVYRVCFSIMGNSTDAEDAVQSIFLKLMEKKKSFADVAHEKAWLIKISQNHCRDLHRRWWRRKVVGMDSVAEQSGTDLHDLHKEVMDSLMQLPASYRILLYLYYYEGYKIAEISSMLNININTLKTRLRNAKKRLKIELGDDYYE